MSFIHLFAFTVYTWLVFFVLMKNSRSRINRVSALFVMCFALWNFADAFMHSSGLRSSAMLWQNIGSFGWIGFSGVLLWQSLIFTKKEKVLKSSFFYILIILITAGLVYMQWSGFLIEDLMEVPYGWHNIWASSIWPVVFVIYVLLSMMISFMLLLKYRKKSELYFKRKQVAIIIASVFITFFLGFTTDIMLPQLGIVSVPPLASVFTMIWAGGLVYAVNKYGFMSITPETAASDILYSMADSLILVDLEGIIVTANKATTDMLGYEKEEIVGKHTKMLFKETEEELFKGTILQKLMSQSSVKKHDMIYRTKGGVDIPVSLSGSLVHDKEGDLVGIVYIARDMRENIKKNRELKELYDRQARMKEKLVKARMKEKLDKHEKLAMIGRLTGSVGHEIRTPLASIRNAVYYINNYGNPGEGHLKEYVNILTEEVNHVQEIVSSLMDFSRTTKVERKEINVEETIDKVLKSIKEREEIKIIKEISPDARIIQADPLKFKQLLKNLVKNAFQAIEDSGFIKIKTEKKSSYENIYVIDNGKGMDEETKKKLFEPLYTTKQTGIGLGMSIIKDIINAHGWELEVISEKDKGTEVKIKIEENAAEEVKEKKPE